MNSTKQPFVDEKCVLVTNDSATIEDFRLFLRDNLESVLPRVKTCSSRLMILSGCHGSEKGKDGVNSLDCLTSNDKDDKKQTRNFYEKMCKFFGLKPEGVDPRVYDPKTKNVIKISPSDSLVWNERSPLFLPGRWLEQLKIQNVDDANIVIKIIDVATYNDNIEGLLKEIKKFEPSNLVVDWCFNNDGFTMNHLKASGIVSSIILQNEEFLQTKKSFIQLSDEQRKVLKEARSINLRNGEAFFVYGDFGSGKTIIGIEVARIISSRRKIEDPGKTVKIVYTAPGKYARHLLKYHQETSFTLEMKDSVKVIGIEQFCKSF